MPEDEDNGNGGVKVGSVAGMPASERAQAWKAAEPLREWRGLGTSNRDISGQGLPTATAEEKMAILDRWNDQSEIDRQEIIIFRMTLLSYLEELKAASGKTPSLTQEIREEASKRAKALSENDAGGILSEWNAMKPDEQDDLIVYSHQFLKNSAQAILPPTSAEQKQIDADFDALGEGSDAQNQIITGGAGRINDLAVSYDDEKAAKAALAKEAVEIAKEMLAMPTGAFSGIFQVLQDNGAGDWRLFIKLLEVAETLLSLPLELTIKVLDNIEDKYASPDYLEEKAAAKAVDDATAARKAAAKANKPTAQTKPTQKTLGQTLKTFDTDGDGTADNRSITSGENSDNGPSIG